MSAIDLRPDMREAYEKAARVCGVVARRHAGNSERIAAAAEIQDIIARMAFAADPSSAMPAPAAPPPPPPPAPKPDQTGLLALRAAVRLAHALLPASSPADLAAMLAVPPEAVERCLKGMRPVRPNVSTGAAPATQGEAPLPRAEPIRIAQPRAGRGGARSPKADRVAELYAAEPARDLASIADAVDSSLASVKTMLWQMRRKNDAHVARGDVLRGLRRPEDGPA
ncbi:hypothetical protein [Microcystis phage Mwe-JY25]